MPALTTDATKADRQCAKEQKKRGGNNEQPAREVIHLLSRSHNYTSGNEQDSGERPDRDERGAYRHITESSVKRCKDNDKNAGFSNRFSKAILGASPIEHANRSATRMPVMESVFETENERACRTLDFWHMWIAVSALKDQP